AGKLITLACKLGPLEIKRVYADARKRVDWCEAPGFNMIHAGCGKNAADILLAIEAVDLAHKGRIGTFVLASSDSDFCHLAHRLREAGLHVLGVGEAKTGERFRKSCSAFHELQQPNGTTSDDDLDAKIRAVFKQSPDQKSITVEKLNEQLWQQFKVKIRDIDEGGWKSYLSSHKELYSFEKKGSTTNVTLLT
ncbi:MAG: NYN domain-containing protein, partial [Rhodobacteraceae bacterium]